MEKNQTNQPNTLMVGAQCWKLSLYEQLLYKFSSLFLKNFPLHLEFPPFQLASMAPCPIPKTNLAQPSLRLPSRSVKAVTDSPETVSFPAWTVLSPFAASHLLSAPASSLHSQPLLCLSQYTKVFLAQGSTKAHCSLDVASQVFKWGEGSLAQCAG